MQSFQEAMRKLYEKPWPEYMLDTEPDFIENRRHGGIYSNGRWLVITWNDEQREYWERKRQEWKDKQSAELRGVTNDDLIARIEDVGYTYASWGLEDNAAWVELKRRVCGG